ncbi:MAG: hypothetical protein WCT14_18850 [Treponemataceae bacterium]
MNSILTAAAVALVFWAASFLYFRSYLSKRTSSQRILAEFRDEVEKLVAEIDAATDRDVQLVEERMKALRSLLDEAEKRIGTMRREVDRRSSEERAYSELGKRARTMPLFSEDVPQPTRAGTVLPAITLPLPAQSSSPESQPKSMRNNAVSEPSQPQSPGAETPGEAHEARFIRSQMQVIPKEVPFADRVAELHRAGFSAEIIATRLGKTVGEVELVIALGPKMEQRNGNDTGN